MKILIVEDSEEVAKMLNLVLHDYEVEHARNGKEAIEMYYENSIDLVLWLQASPVTLHRRAYLVHKFLCFEGI